jgi:metallo-beta-lactamase family protein
VAEQRLFQLTHHGAVQGVTGSCHQLTLGDGRSVLIDCGLFQGDDVSPGGARFDQLSIDFDISQLQALILTHVHLDHVGRIPYLLAAGFKGPIICSIPSARLLPLVLEDALKMGLTRDSGLIARFIRQIRGQLHPLPYARWYKPIGGNPSLGVRLRPAGHILGSAYVQLSLQQGAAKRRIIFSGDLGAPYSPLLPAPQSPYSCDLLILESTYGDKKHAGRKDRADHLQQVLERALANRGTLLIPAFSIGRTQELLYELEQLIHRNHGKLAARGLIWDDLEIIVDSPLAARFTQSYRQLRGYWDKEARRRLRQGRHPLNFEQLITIEDHKTHMQTVSYLARTRRPAVVIAASGMCAGGRVVNYLKAMLEDARHDILFVGYQANGTPGRTIQQYGPRGGYVDLDGQRLNIRAGIHTISGYSAHAGQDDLLRFVRRMRRPPAEIRLVHGDEQAKKRLRQLLQGQFPQIAVSIPEN